MLSCWVLMTPCFYVCLFSSASFSLFVFLNARCCLDDAESAVPRCVCINVIISAGSLSPFIFNEQWGCVASINRELDRPSSTAHKSPALFIWGADCCERLLMMCYGYICVLTATPRAGDEQNEVRKRRKKAGPHKGALQHSQHCQCEAMRLNYKCMVSVGFISMRPYSRTWYRHSCTSVNGCGNVKWCVYINWFLVLVSPDNWKAKDLKESYKL